MVKRRIGRIGALVALALAAGACAPAPKPIPNWTRDTCRADIVPVETPWNDVLAQAFRRLYTPEARHDTGGRDLAVVAALMPEDTLAGAVCTARGWRASTIYISLSVLERSRTQGPERELLAARFIAHELAHVTLHHNLRWKDLDLDTKEAEADDLGLYYFERAGYDCRRWVESLRQWYWGESRRLDPVEAGRACDLAKRGERPPRRIPGHERPRDGPQRGS